MLRVTGWPGLTAMLPDAVLEALVGWAAAERLCGLQRPVASCTPGISVPLVHLMRGLDRTSV